MREVEPTERGVLASLGVDILEAGMLAAAAWLTGSVALRSQVAAAVGDMAVQVFLLIGVISSRRPLDDRHPLGYGRERFFWSFLAAVGIFIGGGGYALDQAIGAALHPSPVGHYTVGYAVLGATIVFDLLALEVAVRPARREAKRRGIRLWTLIRNSTDPAATTILVGGASAVISGVVALLGLALSQLTRSATLDTVASLLIGVLMLATSGFLLRTNRELLSGRGVPPSMLRAMRGIVAAQEGVAGVADLFAVVVGPASLIVNGDVIFDDELDVPAVEATIRSSADELRKRWPSIDYVYLTPVPKPRVARGA
ncbi:MAG: cation diffusion facilitator family transporter [Solirubrobacterales bacterium]|nr:cation diffusion facilitator family transporter [Solirubrobacterales bacterium]